MKNKIIIFSIMVFLFFSFGCLDENRKLNCCDKDSMMEQGVCVTPSGEQFDQNEIKDYDLDEGWVEVVTGYTVKQTGGLFPIIVAETEIRPVCSEKVDNSCVDPDCMIMLCGQLQYTPYVPGLEVSGGFSYLVQQKTYGLYNGKCYFVALDEKIENVFDPDKRTSAYLNTFRFGLGEDYLTHEYFRYYFPISDKFCNLNSGIDSGTQRDRYMNYLMNSEYYTDFVNGEVQPYNPSVIEDSDLFLSSHPEFLQTEEFGSFTPESYVFSYALRKDTEGNTLASYVVPDKEFYAKLLAFEYRDYIRDNLKAPFECESAADCYSNYCNTEDYLRSVCVQNGESESGENCLCRILDAENGGELGVHYDDLGFALRTVCEGTTRTFMSWESMPSGPSGYSLSYDFIMNDINYDALPLEKTICKYTINLKKDCPYESCPIYILSNESECYAISNDEDNKNIDPFVDEIQFADGLPQGIGYVYMTADNFAQTAFAQSCDMVEGINYEELSIADITQQIYNKVYWYPIGEELNPLDSNTNGFESLNFDLDDYDFPLRYKYSGEDLNNFIYDWSDEGGGTYTPKQGTYKIFIPSAMVVINDLGSCAPNEEGIPGPEVKSYGWCEPCTLLTMPSQTLELDRNYFDPYSVDEEEICNSDWDCESTTIADLVIFYGADDDPVEPIATFDYFESDFGVKSLNEEDELNPYYGPLVNEFYVEPEITYIQKKSTEYLMNDMLPIIDLSDSSFWTYVDSLPSNFEANAETLPFGDAYQCSAKYDTSTYWGSTKYWECVENSCEKLKPTSLTNDPADFADYVSCISLSETIGINRGPVIAIVASPYLTERGSILMSINPNAQTIEKRIKALNYYCDSCLSAVHANTEYYLHYQNMYDIFPSVKYLSEEYGSAEERMDRNYFIFRTLFDMAGYSGTWHSPSTCANSETNPCSEFMLENLSLLLYDYYPAESIVDLVGETGAAAYLSQGEDSEGTDYKLIMYQYILEKLANQSGTLLYAFNTPSIAYNFSYDYSSNPYSYEMQFILKEDRVTASLSYILANQKNLTANGLVGLRYTGSLDYFEGYTDEPNGTSAIEQGARYTTRAIPTYLYRKVPAVPESTCVECTDYERETGACSMQCLTGGECTLPEGYDISTQYKCPDDVVLEDYCDLCSNFNTREVECTLTRTIYDQKTLGPVKLSELTDIYQDVLANLPNGDVCCLVDEETDEIYYYSATDISQSSQPPIMYPAWLDDENSCTLAQTGELDDFCGVDLSVSINNYKVDCRYV